VPGFGGISWSEYYGATTKGKKAESAEVKNLREKVEAFPSLVQDAVTKAVTAVETKFQEQVQAQMQSQLNQKLMTILPIYMERYKRWERSGRKGPPPVPDLALGSAQSDNMQRSEALVTPLAEQVLVQTPLAPEVAAAKTPTRTAAPPSGSHSATCALRPVDGGPSPLAAFDALKVITKSLNRELGGSTTPMT
jgi:hypothetical protein